MINGMLTALKDSLKTETDMYMMRVYGQIDRYMTLISNQERDGRYNDLQGQIDAMKDAINVIMCELSQNEKTSNSNMDMNIGMMSPISMEEELIEEQPVIVHKLRAEEIKAVHIEQNDEVVDTTKTPMPTPVISPMSNTQKISETVLDSVSVNEEVEEAEAEEKQEVEKVEEVAETEEQEEEEEEEEEDDIEVEEFEFKGVTYFKDAEGTVFECTADGEVGEAVGVLSKKVANKVIFYSKE